MIKVKNHNEAIRHDADALRPKVPGSTYRLQLNSTFTFKDAAAIVGYLSELGITDVYASPYFLAAEGSMHGYDITDPTRLNTELGGQEGFDTLTAELQKHSMGLIADIVPNHMSIISPKNAWWQDLMENGPASPYAKFFDIDWMPIRNALENKVIIPILGDQYGRVLEKRELRLSYSGGAFFITYYDHSLPLDPSTYDMVLSFRLDELSQKMEPESPHYHEALSIITALRHLPARLETSAPKVTERMREKEIIKRRIANLHNNCTMFREHITENIKQYNGQEGRPDSLDMLHCLLDAQVYRLSFWQVSTEEINYRRFFDINSLAAIRTEDPDVFYETHALVLDHVRQGKVTGIRVDHPDGLYDPGEYFTRLQRECAIRILQRHLSTMGIEATDEEIRDVWLNHVSSAERLLTPFYIVGEKILMDNEHIPEDWPICGTTGYAFMNSVNGIFISPRDSKFITSLYNRISRSPRFQDVAYARKKLIMQSFMSSEINVLGHKLNIISESRRHTRDFTLNSLIDTITETIASFPVYRTYITDQVVTDQDARYIEQAIAKAKRTGGHLTDFVFDFLRDVLLLKYPENMDTQARAQWLEFTMKFQQITGPIMAKGLEDTAFYCYNRLISLNEVGGNPEKFGIPIDAFHGQNIERAKHWPFTMNATSTHDSKRSEDVRARINTISGLAGEWSADLRIWRSLARTHKVRLHNHPIPEPNDEYLLYQTLVGLWPAVPSEDMENLTGRIKQFMIKAVREAKTNSNWLNINVEYENAMLSFIDGLLGSQDFINAFTPFAQKAAWYGRFNSLSQTLLKIASPGVPDFYQGTELLNLRLVDPDNRAPVDYDKARRMLREIKEEQEATEEMTRSMCNTLEDGRAKLLLTYRALNYRKSNAELFISGNYTPLAIHGPGSDHCVAFARGLCEQEAIAVAPRLIEGHIPHHVLPLGAVWDGTWLILPEGSEDAVYTNVLTGQRMQAQDLEGSPALRLETIFQSFPAALLHREPK